MVRLRTAPGAPPFPEGDAHFVPAGAETAAARPSGRNGGRSGERVRGDHERGDRRSPGHGLGRADQPRQGQAVPARDRHVDGLDGGEPDHLEGRVEGPLLRGQGHRSRVRAGTAPQVHPLEPDERQRGHCPRTTTPSRTNWRTRAGRRRSPSPRTTTRRRQKPTAWPRTTGGRCSRASRQRPRSSSHGRRAGRGPFRTRTSGAAILRAPSMARWHRLARAPT